MPNVTKYILLWAVVLSGASRVEAQENPFLTQQWYSRINHNPAAAGDDEAWDIFVAHRNQWTGFRNAPLTTLLNVHTSVNSFHSGVGLSLAYDSEGPARSNRVAKFVYSYRITLSEQAQLSFGLGADLQSRTVDYNRLVTLDPFDPERGLGRENKTTVGADFGMEFLTEQWVVGASVTNVGRTAAQLTTFVNGSQYYGYAHYRFPLNDHFELSPTLAYLYGNRAHLAEGGATVFFRDALWCGVAYRLNNAFCFMGGLRFGIFRVGYSYDSHVNDVRRIGATHEVVLSIRLRKPQRGRMNPDGSYTSPPNRVYRCR
jgi:type IX secretion system PorP/SprF family membrane protein